MENKKVVLAYSGGLDTSVAIKWLADKGFDVVAACMDVGEGKDLNFIHDKALQVGASQSIVLDCKKEFSEIFVGAALKGNLMYENKYPLVSALSRPLIAKKLVEVAKETGASAIAHGCTGKGNDQVRFEVAIHALAPELEVIAPVREWHWAREEEINYAVENNIPIPANLDNPYSIDMNLWGRAIEAGVLENPWNTCPEDAFFMTQSVEAAPDEAEFIEIEFENGLPVALDGKKMPLDQLIKQANILAGKHGVGRIDHIENRLVGIKSREFYECPGAITLLKAHKDLEDLTFVRELAHFKPVIENELSNLIYNGLWFNPATQALIAYLDETQKVVNGIVKVKLYKGNATPVGRKSSNSLYDEKLATYTVADEFDQAAAVGFIKLWGLPTQVNAQVNK
ncbi:MULTISPECIES: argininosuccinate synthase [unclassified Lactococcus]|uniref:argininosuccinate synthase n=1 Tax=unclassified Lactococcus TaxID=2643510 RepID=UPI0011CCB4BB|nr:MULTISPECIES: argininosuccinate synthase [unclassified Lactococcus]MQW22749.1 argininosuccinate synthase [Lactococcus sp. dk101]TXK44753.1 argininosuccinate synthase [Lactococcus sp. dk310]TXK50647.1 argininosuccinate synthase [Lactococcus sp. dk322]